MIPSSTSSSDRRRFGLELVAFAAIQVGIAATVLGLTWPGPDHYLTRHRDKVERGLELEGPRLLFVGGSNLAFAVDTDRVAAAFDRSAVNLGLHAGLGLDLELAEARRCVRSGDVVLVSLEYPAFAGFVGGPELCQLLQLEPAVAGRLSWRQTQRVLDLGLAHLSAACRRLLRGARPPSPYYQRQSFEGSGDAIAHLDAEPVRPLVPISLADLRDATIADAIARMDTFAAECRRRGARVFYSFPAIDRASYLRLQTEIGRIETALRAKGGMPLLDRPGDLAYPDELFFDTPYHLLRPGVTRRSEHLIEVLRQVL